MFEDAYMQYNSWSQCPIFQCCFSSSRKLLEINSYWNILQRQTLYNACVNMDIICFRLLYNITECTAWYKVFWGVTSLYLSLHVNLFTCRLLELDGSRTFLIHDPTHPPSKIEGVPKNKIIYRVTHKHMIKY